MQVEGSAVSNGGNMNDIVIIIAIICITIICLAWIGGRYDGK